MFSIEGKVTYQGKEYRIVDFRCVKTGEKYVGYEARKELVVIPWSYIRDSSGCYVIVEEVENDD